MKMNTDIDNGIFSVEITGGAVSCTIVSEPEKLTEEEEKRIEDLITEIIKINMKW